MNTELFKKIGTMAIAINMSLILTYHIKAGGKMPKACKNCYEKQPYSYSQINKGKTTGYGNNYNSYGQQPSQYSQPATTSYPNTSPYQTPAPSYKPASPPYQTPVPSYKPTTPPYKQSSLPSYKPTSPPYQQTLNYDSGSGDDSNSDCGVSSSSFSLMKNNAKTSTSDSPATSDTGILLSETQARASDSVSTSPSNPMEITSGEVIEYNVNGATPDKLRNITVKVQADGYGCTTSATYEADSSCREEFNGFKWNYTTKLEIANANANGSIKIPTLFCDKGLANGRYNISIMCGSETIKTDSIIITNSAFNCVPPAPNSAERP